jgi:hypothetical protein
MPMRKGEHVRLNPLGATKVMVSRLGLGMAALGRPGYMNLGHGQDLVPPAETCSYDDRLPNRRCSPKSSKSRHQ